MVGNELNKRTALALEMQETRLSTVPQVSYFANLPFARVPADQHDAGADDHRPVAGGATRFAKATRALAEAFTDTKGLWSARPTRAKASRTAGAASSTGRRSTPRAPTSTSCSARVAGP